MNKFTKERAQLLWKLCDQWTRCDIMARHGRFQNLEASDYFHKKLEIEDKIRKLLYGKSTKGQLYDIGCQLGILDAEGKVRRK